MKKLIIFLLASLLCLPAFGAVTKSGATTTGWTSMDANTVLEGKTENVSGNYQQALFIAVAITNTTASTNGLGGMVQVSPVTSGNNTWYDYQPISVLSGVTAGVINGTVTADAGNTTINATLITGLNASSTSWGRWAYIRDKDVEANSELVMFVSNNTGAATLLDGTVTAHTANYTISNQTFTQMITLSDAIQRVRVIWDNTKDLAGPSYSVTSSICNITGI